MAHIFITGIAGFIGFHLAQKLHEDGHEVSGMDNFNDYYDVTLKNTRSDILDKNDIFVYRRNLLDKNDTFYTHKGQAFVF